MTRKPLFSRVVFATWGLPCSLCSVSCHSLHSAPQHSSHHNIPSHQQHRHNTATPAPSSPAVEMHSPHLACIIPSQVIARSIPGTMTHYEKLAYVVVSTSDCPIMRNTFTSSSVFVGLYAFQKTQRVPPLQPSTVHGSSVGG